MTDGSLFDVFIQGGAIGLCALIIVCMTFLAVKFLPKYLERMMEQTEALARLHACIKAQQVANHEEHREIIRALESLTTD